MTEDELRSIKRIMILGCGTSWHAGLIGEYIIEEHARIPVEVEYASEFRYRNPIIEPGTVTLAISQSGETIDTLEAMREAKRRGSRCSASRTWSARPSRANPTAAFTSTPVRKSASHPPRRSHRRSRCCR
jgi:glucosamine 6-phosphate synthetase-like amidotransferase/phosphosugar isomerase protein